MGENDISISFFYHSELVADDTVTHISKLLYGSPDFKQSMQEILDRFSGNHGQKSSVLKTLRQSGTFSVVIMLIHIFIPNFKLDHRKVSQIYVGGGAQSIE